MRVHPSILAPRTAKWQFLVAIGLLVLLIIITLVRGPAASEVSVTAAPPPEKRVEVVVARSSVVTGQPLEQAELALEQRPVNTVPADVITSFEVLKGKVAAGPIPAGYALSPSLLADPVAVVPVEETKEAEAEDPIETFLRELERDTVALPVNFSVNAPERGARIAITLARSRGDSLLVIEDCWVSKSNGRQATLRLDANQALLLQAATNFGSFNFIEIPRDVQSPYSGKGVKDLIQLQTLVEGPKEQADKAKAESQGPQVKGCGWLTGETSRYCITEGGDVVLK